MGVLLLAVVLLLGPSAWALCPAPATSADLEAAAQAAEDAFEQLDAAAFSAALEAQRAALPCLSGPISPTTAARLHNTEALAAFLDRNEGGTLDAFRAALIADPAQDLGEGLEQTHPIRYERRYAARFEAPPVTLLRPLSSSESALADGRRVNERYTELPVVLQRVQAEDGTVLASLYLPANAPLPDWVEVAPPPLSTDVRRHLRLGGLAVAATLTSGVLIRGAVLNRRLYLDPSTPYDRLDTLESRANLYSSLSIGSAVVGAGVGLYVVRAW